MSVNGPSGEPTRVRNSSRRRARCSSSSAAAYTPAGPVVDRNGVQKSSKSSYEASIWSKPRSTSSRPARSNSSAISPSWPNGRVRPRRARRGRGRARRPRTAAASASRRRSPRRRPRPRLPAGRRGASRARSPRRPDEVQDELRERGVEPAVRVGQLLGAPDLRVDARQAFAHRLDELRCGVDGRDVLGANATRELRGQRARPAADVEDGLARLDPGGVRERDGEPRRVAAHEPVVDVSGDRERAAVGGLVLTHR